jgi:hypothetical protein
VLEDARRAQEAHATNLSALNNKQGEIATLNKQLESSAVAAAAVAKIPELAANAGNAKALYDEAAKVSIEKKGLSDGLAGEHQQLLAQRAEAKSRATAIDEANKKKAEALVLKETVGLLQSLQEEIVKQSVKPILDVCNSLCQGILRLPLVMCDGEIGMQGDTGFVGHRTLSDSEKLLTYAALSIALAAEAPFKLCVIGRFESFDLPNKIKLIGRALELVQIGKLDQCLFVEVSTSAAKEYADYSGVENFSVAEL